MDITMHTIAHIHTDLPEKFGVPRQSGLVPQLQGTIVFEPDYRNPDALRGLEGFSHLWLIFRFHRAEREGWSPTVRPPRLGGNTRMGVFATRSPFRPNPIGLSCVKLAAVERHEIMVALQLEGTTRKAAKRLGITQSTLVRRMKDYQLYLEPTTY